MNYAVIAIAFLLGGLVASMRGLETGFMCVYFPFCLFFSSTLPIPIAYWPHISPPHAALYGIIVGALISGKKIPSIKFGVLDVIMLAVPLLMAVSTAINVDLHLAANAFDIQVMEWIAPYFLARLAFTSEPARAAGLRTLAVCLIILGFFGLIETRLIPYFVARALQPIGLWSGGAGLVYHRFGFMRAMLTFDHPIDLGNVALMFVGIIPILALTSEVGMRKWYVRLAWGATFLMLLVAISFTAYFGLAALAAMYLLLKYVRFIRRLLVPIALVGMCVVAIYTSVVLSEKMPPRPPSSEIFEESLWIRQLIVHRGWAMAQNAGWFGYGPNIDTAELRLSSVDNAYILLILLRGWCTLVAFLLIPIALGARLSRALAKAQNQIEARPLMLAAATVTGIMIAMYTVWFGFVYANIFVILIGFSATLAEFFFARRTQPISEIDFEQTNNHILHPLST